MKVYGLTVRLKNDPEKIAAYKAYHRAVWPEVLARLRSFGVHQMRIFLHENRLFMYLETDDDFDPRRDFPRIKEAPKSKEWNEIMATLQERSADEGWSPMELVFDLNWPENLSTEDTRGTRREEA
ncbi:MAG TPA: L-rhamnose mutarotase [Chloroflexota bacterium]